MAFIIFRGVFWLSGLNFNFLSFRIDNIYS
jgi:hypothetical protein